MKSKKFNINIAIIGHVSVGKTTLLNAVLGDKFSEVNKRRTTAGVSHFHISPLLKSSKVQVEGMEDDRVAKKSNTENNKKMKNPNHDTDNNNSDDDIQSPHEILAEIKQDNIDLRKRNIIQHKHYNIETDETLLKMRPDTSLTIIDVPGLNEAGTQDMYTSYVKESWDTYDCALVVMDVSQGVNTEEQVKLLKFVEANVRTKKSIPVIVVCNKVDDVDDDELMELVDEVQAEVDMIFQTEKGHKESWDEILQGVEVAAPFIKNKASSPAFIHMSAENAFLYRSISSLTLKDFSTKVDRAYIDRIGKAEFGYVKWRKMKKEQKYKAIHDLFSDPNEYEERLAMTNYDKLMKVLKYFIGGDENQKYLIGQQIDVEFDHLSKEGGFAKSLSRIHDCCVMVGKDTSILSDRFWSLFKDCKSHYMGLFEKDPEAVETICIPMQELIEYHEYVLKKMSMTKGVEGMKGNDESHDYAMKEMSDMIKDYINVVIAKIPDESNLKSMYDPYVKCSCGYYLYKDTGFRYSTSHPAPEKYVDCWEWNVNTLVWRNKHTGMEREGTAESNPAIPHWKGWERLTKRDYSNILNSILLMKHKRHFYKSFGNAILDISWYSQMRCNVVTGSQKCSICSRVVPIPLDSMNI